MILSKVGALEAEQSRIIAAFAAAGAQMVDPPMLQPSDTLLDLYGEDIRGRAFVTRDPLLGELMLRPDFTVPVVQMHMAEGKPPARYVYAGKVFRTQEIGTDRPSEYDQIGYEIFDGADAASSDAEVFALFSRVLAGLPLRAATGDMGVLMAAIQGLGVSDRRRAALMRHIWRPRRFRALLDRFGGRAPENAARSALVATRSQGRDVFDGAGPLVGLRSRSEILERVDVLVADASEPAVSDEEIALLDQIFNLRAKGPDALAKLRDLTVAMPELAPAVDRVEMRLEAMAARRIDVDNLDFEGSYGRTTMEYYDGFVFGFYAETRPDLPPVATGGRYDALTRALGGAAAVPAVGGVIRPALTVELGL